MRFRCARCSWHKEFPLPMRPLCVFLFHGRHDTVRQARDRRKLCGKLEGARQRSAGPFSAAGASCDQMLVGSTT